MDVETETDAGACICARCAVLLHPGAGDFYRISIEAVADPSPPRLGAEESAKHIRDKIEKLLDEMNEVSAQEAMDQVYRRMTLYLCGRCYRQWIENPTGEGPR